MLVHAVCNDDCDVAQVKCWSSDVEDCYDRLRAAYADEVEAAAEDDDKPNSVDRSSGNTVDSAPNAVIVSPVSPSVLRSNGQGQDCANTRVSTLIKEEPHHWERQLRATNDAEY